MVVLLASDICRLIIKQQPPKLLEELQVRSERGDEIMLSSITYAELIAGVLLTENTIKHMSLVEEFCERLDDIVPWGRGAVDCYTEIQMQAMATQSPVNMNDAMLAAHAISLSAQLLSVNKAAFDSIAKLELDVWQD